MLNATQKAASNLAAQFARRAGATTDEAKRAEHLRLAAYWHGIAMREAA